MIRRLLACLVVTPMLAVGVQGCRRSPERKIAARLSTLSTTPEQKRLWQQAADQNVATGLLKVEKTDRPITARQASASASQPRPRPPVTPDIPPTVVSALRITASAGLENADQTGQASVSDVDATGERVTLNLGANKTVSFIARAGGRPLGIKPGDRVSVEFHARNQRVDRRQILAVRAPNGRGIARITETGRKPLTVSVQLFALEAAQSGPSYTNVDVRVGSDRKTLRPGETMVVGGVTVGVIANRAVTGPDAKTLEGSPYAIELVAWR